MEQLTDEVKTDPMAPTSNCDAFWAQARRGHAHKPRLPKPRRIPRPTRSQGGL